MKGKVDLDKLMHFYEPHPGFAGATIPIPSPVKKIADDLDSKTMSLHDAVARIEAVTDGKVDVDSKYKNIGLSISYGTTTHVWRVIKYR